MKYTITYSPTQIGIIIKSLIMLGEERITISKKEGAYQITTSDKTTAKLSNNSIPEKGSK